MGWGSFSRRGGGLGFEERNLGCPGNFAGMSRTLGDVQKVCAKKVRLHFSFPIKEGDSSCHDRQLEEKSLCVWARTM